MPKSDWPRGNQTQNSGPVPGQGFERKIPARAKGIQCQSICFAAAIVTCLNLLKPAVQAFVCQAEGGLAQACPKDNTYAFDKGGTSKCELCTAVVQGVHTVA